MHLPPPPPAAETSPGGGPTLKLLGLAAALAGEPADPPFTPGPRRDDWLAGYRLGGRGAHELRLRALGAWRGYA